MPTYEYACRQCGEHLEVVQSFKDDPLTECPGCQGQLRKVYSAAGLIFKGSGWHVKDYASSSSKGSSSSSSSSPSSSSPEGSSSSSSDGASSSSSSSTAESA
jgi:putative FmdB family regulatory protein